MSSSSAAKTFPVTGSHVVEQSHMRRCMYMRLEVLPWWWLWWRWQWEWWQRLGKCIPLLVTVRIPINIIIYSHYYCYSQCLPTPPLEGLYSWEHAHVVLHVCIYVCKINLYVSIYVFQLACWLIILICLCFHEVMRWPLASSWGGSQWNLFRKQRPWWRHATVKGEGSAESPELHTNTVDGRNRGVHPVEAWRISPIFSIGFHYISGGELTWISSTTYVSTEGCEEGTSSGFSSRVWPRHRDGACALAAIGGGTFDEICQRPACESQVFLCSFHHRGLGVFWLLAWGMELGDVMFPLSCRLQKGER